MSEAVLSLGRRARSAAGWVLGSHFATQAVRLGGNLVLTRLLVPEAFGLMAMVYVLMIGLALFSDLGTGQSIVQSRRGSDPVFLNTLWTVQVLRGFLIWSMALLVALALPQFAAYGWLGAGTVYADPLLPWVIAVFSLTAIISGFDSTKLAEARRELRQRPVAQIDLASQLTSLVVMLFLAWWFRTVWALVAGALIASCVRCVCSHRLLPGTPNRFQWDGPAFRESFHFGKWIFLTSIIGFLVINGDRLLLGRLVSSNDLGLYSIAFLLANTLQMLFTSLLGAVVFPAFGEVLRSSPEKAPSTYFRFQMLADLLLFGAAGFLLAASELIVQILYDARYQGAGFILGMLGLGLMGGRYQVAAQYGAAAGKVQYQAFSALCRLIVLYVGLPLGFWHGGMNGALVAIVLSQFAEWPMLLFFKVRHRIFSFGRELLGIPVFFAGFGMGWLLSYVARILIERF